MSAYQYRLLQLYIVAIGFWQRNAAGDSLYAWVSATPVDGGIPAINSTQLIVRAVIAVDPSPETDHVVLTEQEVVQANGSGGIDEIISLSVEVRHNSGNYRRS